MLNLQDTDITCDGNDFFNVLFIYDYYTID